MKNAILRTTAVAATLVTIVACNASDSTSAPKISASLVISQDLASQTGAVTSAVVQNVLAAEALTGSASFVAPSLVIKVDGTRDARICTPPAADGWIGCTSEKEDDGLLVTRAHRFFGPGGFLLTWGPTVDSAQYRWSVTGVDSVDRDRERDSLDTEIRWVNRGDTSSLRPIRTVGAERRIWNFRGGRNDSSLVVGERGKRLYKIIGNRVGTDVTWKLPRNANPWPISGTIAHTFNATVIFTATGATKSDTTLRSGTSTVTFNGTRTVPVIVGALTCTLDLQTRKVSACTGS